MSLNETPEESIYTVNFRKLGLLQNISEQTG